MSPRGYPDFQRRVEKSSETVLDINGKAFTGSDLAGSVNAELFWAFQVVFTLGTGPGDIQINHYRDKARTDLFATRLYTLEAGKTWRMVVPSFGNWVDFVAFAATGGTADTYSLAVNAVDRPSEAYALPTADDLLYTGLVSVPAGATVDRDFNSPYFGEAGIHAVSLAANYSIVIQGRNRDGLVERRIDEFSPLVGGLGYRRILIPPLRMRARLVNNDGGPRLFLVSATPVFL